MTPLQVAIDSVGRAVASFHPRSVPLMLRVNYARELVAWCLLPLMLGTIEGGVAGVLAKTYFEGVVPARTLNLAVAVISGAPAFANVVSFFWAAVSHGRRKVPLLVGLQIAAAACVVLIATIPRSPIGLVGLCLAIVMARMAWSGVVTIRSTIWRANYPRNVRASLAGKLATVLAIAITGSGFAIGFAIDYNPEAFRVAYPLAALAGVVGAVIYAGVRMRRQRAWIRGERDQPLGSRLNPAVLREVLYEDDRFRRYMTGMFIFGAGNLMVTPLVIIMLRDEFGLNPLHATMIAAVVPTALMPLSIPVWARLLDRTHIVRFRCVHSWFFICAGLLFLLGGVTRSVPLLWAAAVVKGVAIGGGVLGWNLGHHDFASPERANQYMGVHVTLTGIRGLLAPIIAVCLYELLETVRPGAGPWTLLLCILLSTTGALCFIAMRGEVAGPGHDAQFSDGPPVASGGS